MPRVRPVGCACFFTRWLAEAASQSTKHEKRICICAYAASGNGMFYRVKHTLSRKTINIIRPNALHYHDQPTKQYPTLQLDDPPMLVSPLRIRNPHQGMA